MFILLTACGMSKKTFICGNDACENKKEFDEYFESNMSVEVKPKTKLLKKKFNKKVEVNLVSINLNKDTNDNELNIKTKYIKKKNSLFKLTKLNKEKKNSDTKKKDIFFKIPKIIKDKKVNIIKNTKKQNIKKDKNIIKEVKKIFNFNKSEDLSSLQKTLDCSYVANCDINQIANYIKNKDNKKNYPKINIK